MGNVRSGCRNPFNSNDILLTMSDGRTALNATTDGLIHITIPVGMLQCNCSIIGDPHTREALVIDPGDEVTRILDLIGRHKLTVKVIVSTHAHIDHVGGLSKLHQFEAQVIHTPGHTQGSVSLYLPQDAGKITAARTITSLIDEAGEKIDIADLLKKTTDPDGTRETEPVPDESELILPRAPQLFSGDTLFAGSIGRTDLWGGSMEQIMDSLRTKLMHLPDETIVHPGHGPVTTIGNERQLNPFLQRE